MSANVNQVHYSLDILRHYQPSSEIFHFFTVTQQEWQ